jgi:anti-sigma factor RsiW
MIDLKDLHALADGELAPSEAAALREAMKSDPVTLTEYNAILNLKDCLRDKVRPVPVDCEEAWRGCVGRLNELDKTRRVEGFVGRYAWALCGAFFLMIAFGGMLNRGSGSGAVQTADLARMVTNLVPTSRSVPPQSTTAVNQWAQDLLGQAKNSVDPARMQIRGAAQGFVDGRLVTRFGLRDANGDLALLVIPDTASFDGMPTVAGSQRYRAARMGNVNCVAWTSGGSSLVLFSERTHEDLAKVADRIRIN